MRRMARARAHDPPPPAPRPARACARPSHLQVGPCGVQARLLLLRVQVLHVMAPRGRQRAEQVVPQHEGNVL